MIFEKTIIGKECIVGDGAHASIERVEFGIPYLTSKNFNKEGINLQQVDYISVKDYQKYFREDSKALTKPVINDLIFSIIGSIGGAYLYNESDNFGLSSSVAIIRPNQEKIYPKYLLYYLKSPYLQKWVDAIKSGSAQGFLSLEMIKNLPLILPPLETQQKIASILSAYDELIENNKQRIKLLESMAEEIYKEWFVRLRFPNYENTQFVDGLPIGWEETRLRECFEHYIGGGWGEDSPNGKNDIPAYVIRGTDIPNARVGNLNFDVLRYHSSSNLSSRKLQANDIVFEVSGGTETQSLGRSLLVSQSMIERFDENIICASFCKLIRVKQEKTSGLFIYLLLNRLYKTGEIMLFQVQSTGISNYKFEEFIEKQKVQIPTKEVQNEFDRLIQPMFDEIQLLGAKNQLLQQTRDLLLPRLISGKLGVEEKLYKIEQNEMNVAMAAELAGDYQ